MNRTTVRRSWMPPGCSIEVSNDYPAFQAAAGYGWAGRLTAVIRGLPVSDTRAYEALMKRYPPCEFTVMHDDAGHVRATVEITEAELNAIISCHDIYDVLFGPPQPLKIVMKDGAP